MAWSTASESYSEDPRHMPQKSPTVRIHAICHNTQAAQFVLRQHTVPTIHSPHSLCSAECRACVSLSTAMPSYGLLSSTQTTVLVDVDQIRPSGRSAGSPPKVSISAAPWFDCTGVQSCHTEAAKSAASIRMFLLALALLDVQHLIPIRSGWSC